MNKSSNCNCKTNNPVIMKKVTLKFSFIALAIIVLSSCGGVNKMKDTASTVGYTVTPEVLEMHGGEVEVTIKTKFPEKYFHKKAVLTATPVVKYEGGSAEYESTTLQGEAVEANNKVIPFEGGEYTYTGKVAYAPEMRESELVVNMSAAIGDNAVEIPGPTIALGVLSTPTLVQVDPKVVSVGDKFERITPETYTADIHFKINKADLQKKEIKAEDITILKDVIEEASANERKIFKGIGVDAYASPDGELELNEKLSEKRKNVAKKFIDKELKGVEETSTEEFFKLMSTAEDWDGFKKLMEESDIQDKELILRVLSMYSDPVVREREIKNISKAFEEIAEKILPELRRSQFNVNIDLVGYSDEELVDLAKSNPDTLNIEEMLYAATLFDSKEDKLAVYKKAAESFPESFRAVNNVGYIQYKMGNVAEAKTSFEAAKAIEDNDVIRNNLGAIALVEGDQAKAEELLTAALGTGEVANYNLGIIKIQQGEYENAVSYFGNKASFNAALAQMLAGENEKALGTINSIEEPGAMDYYLWAVVGARAAKEELVYNNLRNAVGKDPALKGMAKSDLEFRKYRDSETFKGIVE
jgi:Flp pilus assembly protein TadD/outer membrane protein OmpA-like peptidoglycan-associated protein